MTKLEPKVRIISRYDDHLDVSISFDGETKLTKDSFAQECDINHIMARYAKTGQLPASQAQGIYADVSELPSYREALEIVQRAEGAFYALPAELRAECVNDPAVFVERVKDLEWAKRHKLVAESEAKAAPLASQSEKTEVKT